MCIRDLIEDVHSDSDGLHSTAENVEKRQWKNVLLEKSLTLLTMRAELARKKKKHTKWQKQTKLSHITNGNIKTHIKSSRKVYFAAA